MKVRIGRKKYSVYAFDIESHNDEESIAKRETSMWLGCLINEDSKMEDEDSYYYSMNQVIDKLQALSNPKRTRKTRPTKNICVYVYNLSFEWSFLLPVLLNEYNFKFKETITEDDEFVFNTVSTHSVSSVWCIQLKFNKKGGIVLFRDLAKIYGGGLANVAKSFNLETQKETDFDYRKNRLHDHVVTDDERRYCFKDTRIIIDILLEMQLLEDKDFFQASSMASYSMKKMLKTGYRKSFRPYKDFRKEYPELDKEETEFLRKGVAGGICTATKNYQFKEINQKILHIDAHQMHPSQAYKHIFPYGKGTYFKGDPPKRFGYISCVRVRVSYSGVKLHSIIGLIGIEFIDDLEITLWDFEIPTMYKCYIDLEIKIIDGYMYHAKPLTWRKYYADNYRQRQKARKEGNKFNVLYFKLLNNSSYGKLLEKPHNEVFVNRLDIFGIITSESYLRAKQAVNAKYTYLPVGSAIPAYSRVELIEKALLFGWRNVVYFDTDSIFVILNDETWRVWEKEFNKEDFLGGWAIEEISERGQFTAPKRYKLEYIDENTEELVSVVKMAGINFESDFSFDEVNIVSSEWEVKRAFRCKGGTIIDTQRKKVDIQKKYLPIYELNIKEPE